ncbi:MAG: hypothetical protein UX08_C0007G0071 [Candidatus Collierbacteria bacterium GW2011_GWB1_45_35]|uniref:Uncharacterized protein n=2 Tax=Candidatus Collieribacteriota TaxID=1752725 RepID=A0A0G1KNC7_9BACT|nr:MAG: hypothetical protein UW48_C0001G0038 [Microgenomates group bacterium GW2011_GWC1_44_23]KKT84990.1 MAG: hypothetical protein UW84_C0043G0007 [Candidatus Collierbacteria bacterium GW2011_GWA2_44_99]KKT96158.1 MAG: hypothetical protein UW96_C0001G0036 [Candidatus Collierbacteria bacterium GW2011_GWA1_45_15]KKU01198.1 MAG: hypothetical protein UX01_C0001G0042 [Candidatus Collierbacteria bacterium GW2011_GWB2_45_17]KKU05374.1 MAG: hypothetical protein UX08_C0007G0071 [Candidatus Collierbacte
MFEWLFGYKIDPQTTVECWFLESYSITEESAKGNRTLAYTTTWKEYQYKSLIHPKNKFGPKDTLVVIGLNVNLTSDYNFFTKEDFENRAKNVPIRNEEERAAWIDRMLETLPSKKESLDKLITKIESLREGLSTLVDELHSLS